MVTEALCFWKVCHLREISNGIKNIGLLSAPPAPPEGNRPENLALALQGQRDEWQRLLNHIQPRKKKHVVALSLVMSGYVPKAQECMLGNARQLPVSLTAMSKKRGANESEKPTTSFFSCPPSSAEPNWKGGWVWEGRERALSVPKMTMQRIVLSEGFSYSECIILL